MAKFNTAVRTTTYEGGAGYPRDVKIELFLLAVSNDRVVIVTDEQDAYGDVSTSLPSSVPIYTWNLAGYRYGHTPVGAPNRYTFGGLTDQAFRMIPLIEAGETARWPF
ncbi:hypothetical protein SAMN05421504_11454 [Amycolatopsis xylanica]|uniref:Uncharacterized protein n=1 Tax=Amycolatopsis xylanica TaxID=589385 RepID=A0A1H3SJB9_9PSEU|nr:hypothetical protein SAMN05421504_11454 [Amycolatopsis xylanica]